MRFSFWMSEDEKEELKKRAKSEGRSVSNYIKYKCLTSQDLGDWWSDNHEIKFKQRKKK